MDLEHSIWNHPDQSYSFPDEFTNWIEEQRAMAETASIVDQSYHMGPLYIRGPDSIDFYEWVTVNGFDNFRKGEPPMAKHVEVVTPEGYSVRDLILFYLDEEEFVTFGTPVANHWIQFNAETGDYDVTADKPYSPIEDGDPPQFRFEVQGPEARKIMKEVTDGELPEIGFFEMDMISIAGHEVYALGHGMGGTPGLEIFGPYEIHDEVKETIMEAGEEYGIRALGSKGYKMTPLESGWIPFPVPAIYDSPEMKEYREWLDMDKIEANMSIGGSFQPDDISEYYMDPFERGHGRVVDFDTDFIGKEALKERAENQTRERVTFVWNEEDVIDIYASLFREGETYKFIDMPDNVRHWSKAHYDRVEKDGELVGVTNWQGYLYNEREMLAVGLIDTEHAEPGTEVTITWGEENSKKRKVERHVEKEVRATVAPAPYVQGGRRDL
ncbi:aminomethyltransferase family protein [Halobellus rufus]|uniref:aminomethyltransferase family protein n=1 Tax=Halobellus rufus TaxID=1448860 RepID=UPI0018CF2191|nr:aminomethyltransferase family protein [Halobellus rufus]